MDAFFASVEQLLDPSLRGKPVAVGGSSKRGVVAAASYEARKFGVRSAMSSALAAKKCPQLIFVKPHFSVYKAFSDKIRAVFRDYTPLVEPLSLDEAYLDVTENSKRNPSATLIAEEIRKRIFDETGLTASAGVSFNKFLAKTASDFNKPNGLTVIRPKDALEFLDKLPIGKFHGIGKVTKKKMLGLGIPDGKALRACSLEFLVKNFGKAGNFYYHIVRGEDKRKVNPKRIRKSVGAENTFEYDLEMMEELQEALLFIAERVHERMLKSQVAGKTVTLKIKFSDFEQITRSKTLSYPLQSHESIFICAREQLEYALSGKSFKVRLLGIAVSGLIYGENRRAYGEQLSINF